MTACDGWWGQSTRRCRGLPVSEECGLVLATFQLCHLRRIINLVCGMGTVLTSQDYSQGSRT